jgi:hypothetical protein
VACGIRFPLSIDDISDWGVNFVQKNHSGKLVQKKVLLEQGYYQKIGTPVLKKFPNGRQYYEATLQELGRSLN